MMKSCACTAKEIHLVYSCQFAYLYVHTNFNKLLISQVRKAQQVWMEIDVYDFIAGGCKWAEVSNNLWVP